MRDLSRCFSREEIWRIDASGIMNQLQLSDKPPRTETPRAALKPKPQTFHGQSETSHPGREAGRQ